MSSRRRSIGVLTFGMALLAFAAGCGGSSSGSSESSEEGSSATGTPVKTITINTSEYRLQPSSVTVSEAGTYEFNVVNKGSIDHALEVEGNGIETETDNIAPGDSATIKVDLKDGSYEIYCPIDGHRDQGMEGTLTVGSGSGSSSSTTDDDSSTTDDDSSSSGGYG
jgi:plastocyanin